MRRFILYAVTLSWMVAALSACRTKPTSESTGLEPLSFTLYSGHSELFVEFSPLVIGQKSRFAAHLTQLGNHFKAYSSGKLSVYLEPLTPGLPKQQHTVYSPTQPGIFRPELTPSKAGKYRLSFVLEQSTFSDTLRIDSLEVYSTLYQAIQASPNEASSDEITYLKEQAWKIDFANEALSYQPFSNVIHTSGRVETAPGDEFIVAATLDGLVSLSTLSLLPGSRVSKGQTLVNLNSKTIADNNLDVKLAQARTELEKAKASYLRNKQLAELQLVPGQEFEASKAAYENAQMYLNTLSANYSSGGKRLTAPVTGYIKTIHVEPGQFVSTGQPLFTITQHQRVVIRADVAQHDQKQINTFSGGQLRMPEEKKGYGLAELQARVLSVGQQVETGFVPLYLQVNNVGSLLPGAYVELYLETQPKKSALVVPESALIEEQGQFYVYVQTGGESFQKREVRLGSSNGSHTELLSGVKPGERVVTQGGYQIRLSSLSGTLPAHGHEH